MAMKEWNNLPVHIRRSKRNLYNYLAGEITGLTPWYELPVSVRCSRKNLYNYLAEVITGLTPWYELPVKVRGSRQEIYNQVISISGGSKVESRNTLKTVNFSVKDSDDNPLKGVSVEVGETVKTTGSAGGCKFTDVPDGDYNVTVSKEGYSTSVEEISVNDDEKSFEIILDTEDVE